MAKLKAFVKGHKQKLSSVLCALLLFVSVFPLFIYNMSIPRQIMVVISLSLSMLYIMWLLKIELEAIGKGMKYFMMACVIITAIWQFCEQLKWARWGYSFVHWRYIFYYDKPFAVATVLTIFILLPTILRLFRKGEMDTSEWREKYRCFLKDALTSGAILYVFILIFGFVLNRPFGVNVELNFVPFKTMLEYVFSDKVYAYENTYLFVGNVAILLPIGFWFAIKNKKRRIILTLLLPVFISCLIEFSQFVFKNGHVDIDDVILNVMGFYLGVVLKKGIDLIRKRVTRGEETTIFAL